MIDTIFIPVLIFAFFIIVSISFLILVSVSSAFVSAGMEFFSNYQALRLPFLIFLYMIFFGFPISAMVLATFIKSHPIIGILGFVSLILSAFISGILKGVLIQIAQANEIILNFLSDPILSKLVDYFPFIMFLFGCGIIILQTVV